MKTAALAGGGLFRFDDCDLADRRSVLQAALGPQRILAAGDLERRALADIALEHLAVVTDLLDDRVDPLLVDAERLAMPGVVPRMRLMVGLSLFIISSTFFEVMPYSSASSWANRAQRTMSANWLSPWRTTGPSGSLEMISGSTM